MTIRNPKVDGMGIFKLKSAGKEVKAGVLKKEVAKLNEFFIHHQTLSKNPQLFLPPQYFLPLDQPEAQQEIQKDAVPFPSD